MMTIQDLLDLSKTIAAPLFAGKTYPWEALADIGDFILQLGPTLPADEYEQRGENIWIARDAKIFDSAYIAGPCIIDHGAELRQCAFIRGNAIVGKNAVVGNSCELKNVVLFDNVQTPHFNYVGDSILGYKAHMGAGSITSNVKSDKTLVVIKNGAERIETGRKKVGAILGDYVEVGCNSVLNPGTVIGRHSNIYPVSCVRGVIPCRQHPQVYRRGRAQELKVKSHRLAPMGFFLPPAGLQQTAVVGVRRDAVRREELVDGEVDTAEHRAWIVLARALTRFVRHAVVVCRDEQLRVTFEPG